jgi:hypothetical protein
MNEINLSYISCQLIFMTQRHFFLEHPSRKTGSTNNLCALIEIIADPRGEVNNETLWWSLATLWGYKNIFHFELSNCLRGTFFLFSNMRWRSGMYRMAKNSDILFHFWQRRSRLRHIKSELLEVLSDAEGL